MRPARAPAQCHVVTSLSSYSLYGSTGGQTCAVAQALLLRPWLPGALEYSLDCFCRIEVGLRGTLLRRIAPTVVALAKRRVRHIHRPPLALHPCPAPQGTDLSLQAQLLEHGPKLRHPCLPL